MNTYKLKYFKYKAKYFKLLSEFEGTMIKPKLDIQEGAYNDLDKSIFTQPNWMDKIHTNQGGGKKTIDIDKEVKKLVPKINKDFIDLYFEIKMGLHHYKAKQGDEENGEVDLEGKEIAQAILEMNKRQLEGTLKSNNKLLQNIVEGINYGKKSGKDETVDNLLKSAKVFNKLFEKRKKKKGANYSVKRFEKYIIGLLIKLFDAEYEVISKFQKNK